MKIIPITTLIITILSLTQSAYSQNRAPSLYLNYQDNEQGDILINSLRAQSPSPLYTYYCGLQWNIGQDAGGYCGMQEHPNGRNFIYSLWDPVTNRLPITVEYKHKNTQIANFGGEGTGLRSLNFGIGWEADQWYSLVSRVWSTNSTNSLFGYWVYDHTNEIWNHLVTMNYPVNNLKFNTETISFIEDWGGNGSNARTIQYKDGWKRKYIDKSWISFDKSYFDRVFPDAGAVNYIKNYDGGVIKDEYYFMTSGGNTIPLNNEAGVLVYLPNNKSEPEFQAGELKYLRLSIDGNNLLINWDIITSKLPQFSYHIRIYDNAEKLGSPLIIENIKPHLRKDIIDISTWENNKEYFVEFYIKDIFDNMSIKLNEKIIKGILSGVENQNLIKSVIFPNPFTDVINILLNKDFDTVGIEMLGIDGRIVYKETYKYANQISFAVNVPSGIYFLKIKQKSIERTYKILKE